MSVGNIEHYFDAVLDVDGDGKLSFKDLMESECLREDDISFCNRGYKEVKESMTRVDLDQSGFITKEEYFKFIGNDLKSPIESGPQQVHLSLTTNPREMVVTWISKDHDIPSTVEYGLTNTTLSLSSTGSIFTYTAGIDGWTGWIHRVTLVSLSTSTKYYYRVGMNGSWSEVFSFVTPPDTKDPSFSQQVFGVVADQGTYILSWEVINQLIAAHSGDPFDLILHAGDVCYAGVGSEWELEEIWDVWEDWVEPLAANIPYMFSIGNHERFYNWSAFTNRFLMPGAQSGGNGNFWYSFDYGLVHFLCFSSESPYETDSEQYKWMENDLLKANQNRLVRPWIVVSAHRPVYCSDADEWSAHCPGAHLQSIMEPLFLKYKVDLYLCGHQHVYERVHPNINGTVVAEGNVYTNPPAPAYVVQATAGVFMDDTWISPQPLWSASRQSVGGFGKMTVNQTHLHYQFLLESNYKEGDYFWIIKQ